MKQCKVLSRKGFQSLLSQQNSAEPRVSKKEVRKMKWFLHKMLLYSEALSDLGRVDGFDEDEAKCEGNDGSVVLRRLLAAECNPLEALQLADQLLDARPATIEHLREERWPVLGVALVWNGRTDPARARRLPIGPGVVALVAHSRAGRHVRTDIQQHLEVPAVTGLAFRQVEGNRMAVKVGLEVDLGREAPSRAAERLSMLPPLAPAAETCARTIVESNICTR
jgi:hypothetical protein